MYRWKPFTVLHFICILDFPAAFICGNPGKPHLYVVGFYPTLNAIKEYI